MLDPDMSGKLLKDKDKDKHVVNEDKFSVDNSFVEKWSHEISSKLLCGWVLLDEACERAASGCNGDLPLLRDLSGEVSKFYLEKRTECVFANLKR